MDEDEGWHPDWKVQLASASTWGGVPERLVQWRASRQGRWACVVEYIEEYDDLFRGAKQTAAWMLDHTPAVDKLFVDTDTESWPEVAWGQHAEVTTGRFKGLHAVGTADGEYAASCSLGGLRSLGPPPTMGLRPPLAGFPHESWVKPTNGGRRPIVGGPRGPGPP